MVQETTGAPPPRRRGARHVAVLLAYLALTLVMTWPLALHLASAIPGDSFDGWQNYWNLWWMRVALLERHTNPLFTDLLYYPTGVGLYFHTLNPFNGLATLPMQLSAGLFAAYNTVVFLSWTLAGYGAFLLARWVLRGSADARAADAGAFLAGAIFTFAPFHMAHLLGHMQVMSLEWIPFYALYLLRGLEAVRRGASWRRSALLAGLFLALNGLCDWYFVLYLLLFTGAALAAYWWAEARRPERSLRRGLRYLGPPAAAGLLFALLLAPLLAPMVREALTFDFMVRPAGDLYILSASAADFAVPNRMHSLARPAGESWVGNQIAPLSERTIAIGYVALALAAAALWRDRRRAAPWLLAALFFFVLALGPRWHLGDITWDDIPAAPPLDEWTPFSLLNRLAPFVRISRSVSRYALMVQLCVAMAAAAGLAALLAHRRRAALWAAAALALLLAEYWVVPYPISPPDTPTYYTELAQSGPPGALLNLPMNYDRPGYLLYQTVHGRPLTVAYISRDDPRTLTTRAPVLQQLRNLGPDILAFDPAEVGATVLADLGVGVVTLDRYKMPGGDERTVTEAVAAAVFAGDAPHYADDRLVVYAVTPPAAPAPYAVLGALGWGPPAAGANGPARLLRGEEALLHLRNWPAGASIRLRYRTEQDVGLTVATPAGERLAALPPAPNGAAAEIGLGGFAPPAGAGWNDRANALVLRPGALDAVWIEEVALVAP